MSENDYSENYKRALWAYLSDKPFPDDPNEVTVYAYYSDNWDYTYGSGGNDTLEVYLRHGDVHVGTLGDAEDVAAFLNQLAGPSS